MKQDGRKRVVAVSASVLVAAAIGVVTNVLSDSWSLTWWLALGGLVVLNLVLQLILNPPGRKNPTVDASGAGSIAVGGSSSAPITTKVRGTGNAQPPSSVDVTASGAGAVAIGGDAEGEIRTDVS